MLTIGLTGGIGSGKTTVAKIFQVLNVPVYFADERSKHLLENDPVILDQLIKNFPPDIFIDSKVDKAALAKLVFSNPNKLALLNSIMHPAVKNDFIQWQTVQQSSYVIKEAAILIEAGTYKDLDKIILVTAPEELRVKRVATRDKSSEQDILARIKNQMSDEEKKRYSDFVIRNGESDFLMDQILPVHKELIKSGSN